MLATEKEFIQWDVKSWSKALHFWEKNLDWNTINNGLELGGNQGGLSLWLALKGKKTICSDYKNVQENAEPVHRNYTVMELISYQDIDATNIPYENEFDVIVFKSILGGIGRDNRIELQQQVIDQIYKALKPGGKLLFAENLIGSQFHRWMRKRFVNWGSSWRYVSNTEMTRFLHQFSSVQMETTGVLATFGRNEKQRNALAKLDQLIINKISPSKWKYIVYGIAVK